MKLLFFAVCIMAALSLNAQGVKDQITFGNKTSERGHGLSAEHSDTYAGGYGQSARRFLPKSTPEYRGGKVKFRMKVDGSKPNYFTARFFGSEASDEMLLLFIDGKQVGFRHLGDYDYLVLGNGRKPLPERFYYITTPLPEKYTRGRNEVELEIRSYGTIWGYGESFDRYQRNLVRPTIGVYSAYTHPEPCFVPAADEKQGVVPAVKIRNTPGAEILDSVKLRVNNELERCLSKQTPLNQLEMWFVAECYDIKWTKAYRNPTVVGKVVASIDNFYGRYVENPAIVYTDPDVYNYEWLTVGPLSRAVRWLRTEIEPQLTPQRRAQWSEMMCAALDYAKTHRRSYTNQSMIIDMFLYDVNEALAIVDAERAMPRFRTLKYLYESVGLTPWLGIEREDGPEKPLGDNYMQLTAKGLTKELGYVGYYGEVLDWVDDIYRTTATPGVPFSGDELIRNQILRIMRARNYFRYPVVDDDGCRGYAIQAVVGWRDGGHYPSDIVYGDRGIAWDATPSMTAAVTRDPEAIAIAKQSVADGHYFRMIELKMENRGLRVTKALIHIPDEYEMLMSTETPDVELPMSPTMPDFVFSDEENGVVAIKNGEDILYTSLYWRARNAVNNLARVHYITPLTDRIAVVNIETVIDDSGMRYTRPDWTNMGFNGSREWYGSEGSSAHSGEVLPIARIPEGVAYTHGSENIYAGRALFYKMRYGKYIVAMNSSAEQVFSVDIPSGAAVVELTDGGQVVKSGKEDVEPMSTRVFYIK